MRSSFDKFSKLFIYIFYLYIGKGNRPKQILLEKWKKKSPLLEVRKSPL